MDLSSKEIITLSAILAERLTKDLNSKELFVLKVFVSQLNCDINTICALNNIQDPLKKHK